MDIHQLKCFNAVVRCKNFTKAAAELHITQPTLSNHMKALELELGFNLFEKSVKQVVLTDAGKILFSRASEITKGFDDVEKEMKQLNFKGTGEIILGSMAHSEYWIASVIGKFRKRYPNVRVTIKEIRAHKIEDALLNFDIHAAFTVKQSSRDNLKHTLVGRALCGVVLNRDHPLAKRESLDFSELAGEKFILPSREYLSHSIAHEYAALAGFTLDILYTSDSIYTVLELVSAGYGVSVLADILLDRGRYRKLKFQPLSNPKSEIKRYLAYNTKRFLTDDVKYMLGLLEKRPQWHILFQRAANRSRPLKG